MAASLLLDLDEVELPSTSTSESAHSPSLTSAIKIQLFKPPVSSIEADGSELHTTGLSLSLQVSGRYLSIIQQAGGIDSEVCLRFSISLGDFSYSISYQSQRTSLIIIIKTLLGHEIIYSDNTGSQLERDIERELIATECSLPLEDMEVGTKIVLGAKDEDNEEGLQVIVQTINSITESSDYLQPLSNGHAQQLDADKARYGLVVAEPSPDLALLDLSSAGSEGTNAQLETPTADTYDNDIWAGLDQFEMYASDQVTATKPVVKESVSMMRLKGLKGLVHPKPKRIRSEESMLPTLSSSDDSLQSIVPPDVLLQLDENPLDVISLAPTHDISSIPTMPSAVVPLRQNPATTLIGRNIDQEVVEEVTGEEGLARRWSSKATQWDRFRKPPKMRDVRTTFHSEERPSGYARPQDSREGTAVAGGTHTQHVRLHTEPIKERQSNLPQPEPDLYPVGNGNGIFGKIPEHGTSIALPRGPRADERGRGRVRRNGAGRARDGRGRGDQGGGTFRPRGDRGRGHLRGGRARVREERERGSRGRGQRVESFRGHWGEDEDKTQDQWQWPTGYEHVK